MGDGGKLQSSSRHGEDLLWLAYSKSLLGHAVLCRTHSSSSSGGLCSLLVLEVREIPPANRAKHLDSEVMNFWQALVDALTLWGL